MTTNEIFKWIDVNLKPHIDKAIADSKQHNPILLYTPDWLIGIAYRETGGLIAKKLDEGFDVPEIWAEMRGDLSQRHHDKVKIYHGYSCWQIDIDSFPNFIKSGDWKDPYLSCMQAIRVLEDKRLYIEKVVPKIGGEDLFKAITSAYNEGEGNAVKLLKLEKDTDTYTTDCNYARSVWKFRAMYLLAKP